VAKLAAKHGVNANLLFKWRRHYRAGKFGALVPEGASVAATARPTSATLLPVLAPAPTMDRPSDFDVSRSHIEIILASATVRVCGEVSSATLHTVLECLAHRP
jgi:transposase